MTQEILDREKAMIDATPPYGKDYLAAKANFERMQRSQLLQKTHRKGTKGGRRKSQMRKSKKSAKKYPLRILPHQTDRNVIYSYKVISLI